MANSGQYSPKKAKLEEKTEDTNSCENMDHFSTCSSGINYQQRASTSVSSNRKTFSPNKTKFPKHRKNPEDETTYKKAQNVLRQMSNTAAASIDATANAVFEDDAYGHAAPFEMPHFPIEKKQHKDMIEEQMFNYHSPFKNGPGARFDDPQLSTSPADYNHWQKATTLEQSSLSSQAEEMVDRVVSVSQSSSSSSHLDHESAKHTQTKGLELDFQRVTISGEDHSGYPEVARS